MTRGKPCSFDREEVLHRAMELFWRNGYEATGMTQLLEYMGIPRQSFYNTFGSKEDVLFEAIQMYSDNVRGVFGAALEGAETPFEKIDRLFDIWEGRLLQQDGQGCFLGNCVAEFGQTRDRVSELMAAKMESIHQVFKGIFQDAIDRGDLPADRDADVMATTMSICSQGLALMSKTKAKHDDVLGSIEFMKRALKT